MAEIVDHYKKFQAFYLSFLAIIFAGLGAYYLVHFGYYPVAIVNSDIVSASELDGEFSVAYRYYSAVLRGKEGIDVNSREFRRELRRAALEDLIQKSLIYNEARSRIGRQLEDLVENKIDGELAQRANIEESAKLVYGLNLADFRQLVLVPQAQKELLESRLSLEKTDLQSWLSGAAKNAKVFIVTPEFYWDSGALKARD